MNDLPSVSVIVVTRDRPRLLADALASVAAQVPAPLEVRVGDDGAGSVLAGAESLPFLEMSVVACNHGQAAATRNAAAEGARGEVLAFLDDDDLWRAGHLAALAAAFTDPDVGFAWRDSVVARERVLADGRREVLESRTLALEWDDALMRSSDYLPPSAWGVRRSLFRRLGGFDAGFRYSEDWDFVLRAAAATRVRRVPGVSVEVRIREAGNASAERTPERLECLRRLGERHGFPPPPPMTFWEVARAVGTPHAP